MSRFHTGVISIIILLAAFVLLWSSKATSAEQTSRNGGEVIKPLSNAAAEWPTYGKDAGGSRFSPVDQIRKDNVKRLEVAWSYRTGDLAEIPIAKSGAAFEATPVMLDSVLYLSTPFSRVIALDAASGAVKWSFDPKIDLTVEYGNQLVSRGVSVWQKKVKNGTFCETRVFLGTADGRLIALNAADGKRCTDFGDNGEVTLTDGIGEWQPGEYQITSPPAIVGELVIVGSAIADYSRVEMPAGVVRAFDARTGEMRWRWDPISSETGQKGFRSGAANVWAPLSADIERDLIFLPTSAPSPDYYGGLRPGDDRHANSVVALQASTGKLVWAYQLVHHDVWDYDVPAQPALVTIKREGAEVPVVAAVTKMGHLFVLHRETGEPVFQVTEQVVPQSGVQGEKLSKTQPIPRRPPPLVPQVLTPSEAFGVSTEDREWCRERLSQLRSDGVFTPPSTQGTLYYPAYLGGMNWSGMSFDPRLNLLITNTNNLAAAVTLFPRDELTEETEAAWEAQIDPVQQVEVGDQEGAPFIMRREWLLRPGFSPCTPPPWGTLVAVDLGTGDVRWQVPLGVTPELANLPDAAKWGSLNLGGSITTAGGLVFIAAARDNYLRAFDTDTGEVLWKGELPTGGQATPMTYQVDGKQFVVIAAGGHSKLGTASGDYLVAFALP